MTKEEKLLYRLDNARKRYEVKCTELDECSSFSTKQAIKIIELERRICENCRFSESVENMIECYEDNFKETSLFFSKDFGCNKFESKR